MARDSRGRFVKGGGSGGGSSSGAGVSMSVEFDSSDVDRALVELLKNVKNIDAALDEIGGSQVAETQQRFELERDPQGKRWRGLARSTLEKRSKKGGTAARILRDDAELYDSIVHRVAGRGVRWGSNRIYARIHQLGGQAGRGRRVRIEPRPFLGLSEEGKREIVEILRDHIEVSP
jgi:phage virion morphogenesis protein